MLSFKGLKIKTLPGVDLSRKLSVVRCLSNSGITIAPYRYAGNSARQATRVDYRYLPVSDPLVAKNTLRLLKLPYQIAPAYTGSGKKKALKLP